jgi:CheY-like chemotaxis protein
MSAQPMGILLVEDDEVDVMNVQRAFKKHNVENPLHVAGDGVEALAMLRAEGGRPPLDPHPRIVLLDLNMPRMGGIEFLRIIRADEHLHSLIVFVLSTSNEDRDKIEAYDLNVAGYILKPVDFNRFVAAVGTLNAYWRLVEHPGAD